MKALKINNKLVKIQGDYTPSELTSVINNLSKLDGLTKIDTDIYYQNGVVYSIAKEKTKIIKLK